MKILILVLAIFAGLGQWGCSRALWEELATGQPEQRELVAEVERVDSSPREIHLRENSGRTSVVDYDASTRVIYRGREYSVNQLEAGDIVAVELKRDLLGKSYANLIRVQESVRDRGGITTRPGTGIQTVDGTVERVDTSPWEIRIRESSGRTRVVTYYSDTRVIYRGREYPVTQLEAGDIVAVELKEDSRGNSYTNLIRVQESVRDRGGITTRPGTRIQTVDGRVERVDLERGSFEIRDQSGERVLVSLPYNARRSDVDRFRALQAGDYVRVEGRFLDRERFELENFLRDNR
jgi:hypothetical protein